MDPEIASPSSAGVGVSNDSIEDDQRTNPRSKLRINTFRDMDDESNKQNGHGSDEDRHEEDNDDDNGADKDMTVKDIQEVTT